MVCDSSKPAATMFAKTCVFLFSTIVVYCESAYVDTLKPCKIDDGKCQGALMQSVLKDIATSGIPEIGLSPIDPMKIKNVTVSILDILNLTLVEGSLKGIRNCHVVNFGTKIEKRHTWMDMTCNATVRTTYNVFSNADFLQSLTGGQSIYGEGNGKVKMVNLKLRFDFYFIIKKKNGEIYVLYEHDKTTYKHEFAGKVTFGADNLYIGKEESSKTLVALLNQNYKAVLDNFGKYFLDRVIKVVFKFIHTFFDNVPARHYVSDDLSAYIVD